MKLQRLGIRFLSVLFPNWVARYAFHYITHPQMKFVRKKEATFLNSAKQQAYPFKGKNVQTYTWEGKGPGVLCVHGWEGHSGNFKAIITALQQQGLRVHALMHLHTALVVPIPPTFLKSVVWLQKCCYILKRLTS